MRVSASAVCTQPVQLGMISPTRVPLVTPASRNAAAIACVVASSSAKVTRFTGSMTIGLVGCWPARSRTR